MMKQEIEHIFLNFVRKEKLLKIGEKVLIAVSGGVDSVTLLYLLHKHRETLGIEIGVAHFNHNLRGEESKRDSDFTQRLAQTMNVNFHMEEGNLTAKDAKGSLQMRARKARFEFFDKVIEKYHYDKVALGHNRDDNVETVLMSLMKGYGLKGLKGIMPISGRRIHPLLALSRKQIEGYALDQGLKWVEDSSNIKLNYLRNSVRWKLLPEMREINYQIDFLLLSLAEQASEMDRWLNCTVIELEQKGVWKKQKDTIILDIDIFLTYFIILRNYILRYILRQLTPDYHLSPARLEEITQLCLCETGRKIIFGPVEIVKDRNFLIFFVPKRTHIEQELDTHGYFNGDGWCLELKPYLISKVKYVSNREIEYIDEEKICRKLKLRNWRPGDRFIPLGMKGLVKVSDYLINEKLSRYEKERQLVLCDEEKIIWICGKRIDERVKVTQFTNKVLRMTYKLHA